MLYTRDGRFAIYAFNDHSIHTSNHITLNPIQEIGMTGNETTWHNTKYEEKPARAQVVRTQKQDPSPNEPTSIPPPLNHPLTLHHNLTPQQTNLTTTHPSKHHNKYSKDQNPDTRHPGSLTIPHSTIDYNSSLDCTFCPRVLRTHAKLYRHAQSSASSMYSLSRICHRCACTSMSHSRIVW